MSDALLEAIQTRDVDRLARLLAAGADPNEPGKSRYGSGALPPLHAAIGELEALDAVGPYGAEPEGPIDLLVLLLRHGTVVKGWDAGARDDRAPERREDQSHRRRAHSPGCRGGALRSRRRRLLAAHRVRGGGISGPRPPPPSLRCGQDHRYVVEVPRADCAGMAPTRALDVEMVRLLLAHGADPQECDLDHLTALECLGYAESPADPANQERIREIRRLLGAPKSPDPTS